MYIYIYGFVLTPRLTIAAPEYNNYLGSEVFLHITPQIFLIYSAVTATVAATGLLLLLMISSSSSNPIAATVADSPCTLVQNLI